MLEGKKIQGCGPENSQKGSNLQCCFFNHDKSGQVIMRELLYYERSVWQEQLDGSDGLSLSLTDIVNLNTDISTNCAVNGEESLSSRVCILKLLLQYLEKKERGDSRTNLRTTEKEHWFSSSSSAYHKIYFPCGNCRLVRQRTLEGIVYVSKTTIWNEKRAVF